MNQKDFAVNFLITKDNRNQFIFNLEKLLGIKEEKKLLSTIQNNFLPEETDFLKTYLKSKKQKVKATQDLKEDLLNIPIVKITLPFSASTRLVLKIASLLKSKKITFLLQIEKDPSLLAGALIEYKGKFWDFSLKSFLKEKGEL